MVLGALLACKGGSSGGASSGPAGKLNEQYKLNDSTWTILEAKDMGKTLNATSELFANEKKNTGGKFVQIHYKVVNNGKKQETLLDTPKVVDSKGHLYSHIEGEEEYVPKGGNVVNVETLGPGAEKEYYTIIDVPADATGIKIQITGLGLMGDKKFVDMGF